MTYYNNREFVVYGYKRKTDDCKKAFMQPF